MVLTNANVVTWLEAYVLQKTMTSSATFVYEYDAEVAAKLQEKMNYYNRVHPDRSKYVTDMNKLDNELAVLVASQNTARETNRKKRASIGLQMDTRTATLVTAMKTIEDRLAKITIFPTV